MRAAVLVSNDVGVALNALAKRIRPLECKFDGHGSFLNFFLARYQDGVGVECFSSGVELLHEF